MPKRRTSQPPAPAPSPSTGASTGAHFPWLQRFVPQEFTHLLTWREYARAFFLRGRTAEQRFMGLRDWLFCTWPDRFVTEVRPGETSPTWAPSNNWNPWLERHLKAFTNEKYAVRQGDSVFRFIGLTGAGSCGKTFASALYALAWWACDPEESIVVLTSTTKDMIRSRVWSVIQDYATSARDACTGQTIELGHIIPSQMKLLSPSKSSKHSISAYAVAHGETLKAIDNLKGLHAKRMLVVIDEANGTPEAIFQVLPNYRKGCLDLTVIVIGNPVSRLDPHGRALKPSDGWALAADDTQIEWLSEGVPDWQVDPGLVLRFDGRDSPNVKLQRNRFPYLYTHDNWLQAQTKVSSSGGTFAYWSFERGMWPPEGLSNTIFTEQIFFRCEAVGTHFTFESERLPLLALDPAFGGDACMCYFGFLGNVGGRQCLQLVEHFEIPIDPTATQVDIDWQIARTVKQECITRGVKPYCFALDSTGVGRGVASILASEWSPQIQCINFGVGATERATSQLDGRPARETYSNFVSELWCSVREAVEAGQIKGFSTECVVQFCSRLYEMKGKKLQIEPKQDMKLRIRYSPDIADACCILVEAARRNGLELAGTLAQKAQTIQTQSAKAFDGMISEGDAHGAGGWADPEDESQGVIVGVQREAWDGW